MYMYVTELVQGDGVIAMIRRIPNPGGEVQSDSVTYVTYDPSRKDFVEHTEGGYGDISQLQVETGWWLTLPQSRSLSLSLLTPPMTQ